MTFLQVKAEYIADFYPDNFMRASAMATKFVVVPDVEDIRNKIRKDGSILEELKKDSQHKFLENMTEWLALDQTSFSLTGGGGCDKIGVTYTDFKTQEGFCSNIMGRYIATTTINNNN